MERPFICSNCRNWHVRVPMPEGFMCRLCAERKHAAHPRTGVIDCHWGMKSATPSEIKLAIILETVESSLENITGCIPTIREAEAAEVAQQVMGTAKSAFANAQQAERGVGEAVQWASVFEVPGMLGEPNEKRFKSFEVLQSLVKMNRRPVSDVEELERSVKTCNELANQITGLMPKLQYALEEVGKVFQNWAAPKEDKPEEQKQAARDRMAHARAARQRRPIAAEQLA